MKLNFLLVLCAVSLGACATVRINHDGTNTIAHESTDNSQALADRVCQKAGEQSAIIVSTLNKDSSLPPGTGKQVTTFHCSSDKR